MTAKLLLIDSVRLMIHSRLYFLKIAMMKTIWMCTFITAFPMVVARRKVFRGMRKYPHVMPARSKRGLGIDAQARMV